jgi:hypothetical protein
MTTVQKAKTKQLGQVRPSDTTPIELYSPTNRDRCVVQNIIICNTTGSSATYRIFVDEDGTTVDQTTAIAYDIALAANTTDTWEIILYMNDPAGRLSVATGTGDALTFTANGEDGSIAY